MSETKNPPVADTLAMIGARAAAMSSQLAAVQKRYSFVRPLDRDALAMARACFRLAADCLRSVEDSARAGGAE